MGTANSVPELLGEQELNPVGHTTRIIETLHFFGSSLPSVFEKSFTFQCQENPTSWSIRLAFCKVPGDGDVTCEITIKRLDDAPVDMERDALKRMLLDKESNVNLEPKIMLEYQRNER